MNLHNYTDLNVHLGIVSFDYVHDEQSVAAHKVVSCLAVLLIPLVLLSNGMVLCTLVLSPSLYSGGRFMLLNLSVINILIGVFSLPLFAIKYWPKVRAKVFTNRFACLLLLTSLGLPGAGTLYLYLLIAVDRFVAVQWPIKYSIFLSEVKSIKIVNFMWTYIVSMCILMLSIWGAYDPTLDPRLLPCKYNTTMTTAFLTGMSSSIFINLIVMTIVVNFALTLRTTVEVRGYEEEKSNMSRHKTRQVDYLLASTKVTNLLLIIFYLLWTPSVLVWPLTRSEAFSEQQIEIYRVTTQLLRLTNAVFHAPVHALARKELRTLFMSMMSTPPWNWSHEMASFYKRACSTVDTHVRFSIHVTTFDITSGSCSPKYSATSVDGRPIPY